MFQKSTSAAMTILALLLVSCVSDPSPQAQSSESGTLEKLVIAISEEPDYMDVTRSLASATRNWAGRNVAETLAVMNLESGEMEPLLAESWEQTEPRRWLIHLRTDVEFSDGSGMTSEDVASSINWGVDDKSASWANFYPTVEKATALDESTVEIATSEVDPVLDRRLSYLFVLPEETLREDFLSTELVGTGPYKLKSWQRGRSLVLERNDLYWGEEAAFESVEFLVRPEANVRVDMVRTGEAHIAIGVPPELADQVANLVSVPGGEVAGFMLNTVGQNEGSIMEDKRVRQAVSYAIDRQAIIDSVFGGLAEPAHCQFDTLDMRGTDPNLEDLPYDPERARSLIQEAGVEGSTVRITMMAPGLWLKSQEQTEATAGYLREVGLKPEITTLSYDRYLDANVALGEGENGPFDMVHVHGGNEYFESSMKTFNNMRSLSAGGGRWMIGDPQMDELARKASSETNPEERLEYMQAFWQRNCEEAYMLAIAVPQALYAVDERIAWQPRPDGVVYLSELEWNEP